MPHFGAATFPKSTAAYYIDLIDEFPEEFVNKYPIIHVLRAGLLLNNAAIPLAIEKLAETQKELEAIPPTKDNRFALSNIYFMLELLSLGSCDYDFTELFRKASNYFPEGGIPKKLPAGLWMIEAIPLRHIAQAWNGWLKRDTC